MPPPATVPAAGEHDLPVTSTTFVGRDLAAIDSMIADRGVVIGQVVLGLSRTDLAAHYAHAHPLRTGLRWLITADSPDNITGGLASLARRYTPLPI